jgi:hypothetical protein
MSSPSFDTHAFIKRLKDAGISKTQAEAQTEALTQALEQFRIEARLADLASKRDLFGGIPEQARLTCRLFGEARR